MYFFLMALLCIQLTYAQDLFITRHGQVSFFGKTAFENVEAVNNESSSVLNAQTGEIGFAILIKGFHFEKALMEEHFNEDYMESNTLPKASFKGKISNPAAVNFARDGAYPVNVDGDMTIHGVTKKIAAAGTIIIKAGLPQVQAKFKIAPKDYNIKIPSLVVDKIAEYMNVTVDCKYEKK